MAAKDNRIQCLDRALDALETVAEAGECGVSELARRLGLHVATVNNLARTLTLRGYLVNAGRRYRLGPAAHDLASAGSREKSLVPVLLPFVRETALRAGESAIAAVLTGFQLDILISCPGANETTVHFPNRTVQRPLVYATGRLLVALGSESLWPEFIERHAAGREECEKPVPAEKMVRELRAIRRAGAAVVKRPGLQSVTSAAAPVRRRGCNVVAAIGVSCPNVRIDREKIELMRKEAFDAARRASACLGCGE